MNLQCEMTTALILEPIFEADLQAEHRFDESHSHDIVPEIFLPAWGEDFSEKSRKLLADSGGHCAQLQPADQMF